MAEKKEEKQPQQQPSGKRLPLKTMIFFLVVLLLEGAAITTVFWLAGGPADVKADGAAEALAKRAEQAVELPVIEDRFQNTRTGRTYLYETKVVVVVKRKDQEKVEQAIIEMENQIATDIAQIIRRAEPAHLLEPSLSTLTRQVHAALNKRFGNDADGESLIEETLIRKCHQYRADY